MKETTIKAVELVRRIRDRHAALLQDKSPADVRAFFQREAAAANAEAECLLRIRQANPEQTLDQPKQI